MVYGFALSALSHSPGKVFHESRYAINYDEYGFAVGETAN
jgi:hypothetical protein